MDEATDIEALPKSTMKDYRKYYRKRSEKFKREVKKEDFKEMLDFIIIPKSVDMTTITGTDCDVAAEIDRYYANDGRFFMPEITYPSRMLDCFGKDYRLNTQGIYYRDRYSPQFVTSNRKVWVPTFEGIGWKERGQKSLRKRARVFVEHNINNERWTKSEYAWEADVWSDVFGKMRNDPCLEVDKHDYFMNLAQTDHVSCKLTGETTLVLRTPDATFGLATFSERDVEDPPWTHELLQDRLEKLLLHRKCGLLSDPKWGDTNLIFPFAVYEAKGWSGDCREARRQACVAAAAYLDLLDDLVRTPGPVGSTKPYQTSTSHNYQVFALTSFGAHWHVMVGYRRPREVEEHAGMEGMSETVYVFQKIWSGRVIDERTAWELLSLIEQIHQWAITEYRSFILKHLRPWHEFCEENYLLDWDSVYDTGRQPKRKRTLNEGEDLLLPSWVNYLSESNRQKQQLRAKKSLAKALMVDLLRKWKEKCVNESGWVCPANDCFPSRDASFRSNEAFLDHIRACHSVSEGGLIWMKRCLDEAEEISSANPPISPFRARQGPAKRMKVA